MEPVDYSANYGRLAIVKQGRETKKMTEDKDNNLVSLADRTTEEQRSIATLGGVASGKSRRESKVLKEIAKLMLESDIDPLDGAILSQEFSNLDAEDMTQGLNILSKQFNKALEGDTKAFEVIRDTAGQSPARKLETKDRTEHEGWLDELKADIIDSE